MRESRYEFATKDGIRTRAFCQTLCLFYRMKVWLLESDFLCWRTSLVVKLVEFSQFLFGSDRMKEFNKCLSKISHSFLCFVTCHY